ncbi:hypothetical protein Aph01nite_18150 [Acrocarpospora phusangensis]|uniref:Enoyl reductase (ER) domain-containing protein n=1 Tax=Acrocarpospora phusangensis TaxID=1070424 RepID=A0A919QA16_9ACTN|nr:NAD(P)-dependent alcohol dehydrogenase [Acrocarpospora phusangensis]GIH23505.1 hypothetical protein Aph01nite_18150 [Acrocarpospora phusangensis]
MRAVVCDRYGPPEILRLKDVESPVPREDEILVKVHATTVTRTDCGFRQGKPAAGRLVTGLRRPKWPILGLELAGEVAAAGAAVTEFETGDEVFGINPWRFGAHAEFVCVPQSAPVARKPAGMPFDEAAAVCDGVILALLGLKHVALAPGKSILVYGASGSIGTAAVQLARHYDADVTAVCDTRNVETVRSLGAHEVVDYTREDFTKNGRAYDVILDAVGSTRSNTAATRSRAAAPTWPPTISRTSSSPCGPPGSATSGWCSRSLPDTTSRTSCSSGSSSGPGGTGRSSTDVTRWRTRSRRRDT